MLLFPLCEGKFMGMLVNPLVPERDDGREHLTEFHVERSEFLVVACNDSLSGVCTVLEII